MTQRDRWKKRPAVVQYHGFKDNLRLLARANKLTLSASGDVIVFLVPMPPSWSERKRDELNLKPHMQRPDLDNYLKALWDALEIEDKHIWGVTAYKLWSTKGGICIFSHTQGAQ